MRESLNLVCMAVLVSYSYLSKDLYVFSFDSVRNKTSVVLVFPVNGVYLENECEM